VGESLPLFSPNFNRAVQIEAREEHLSSDAGALLLRESEERPGLVHWLSRRLVDSRDPDSVVHPLSELLRTALLLLAQGYDAQDDADRLRLDPALRLAVSDRRGTAPLESESEDEPCGLASQPTLSRLLKALSTSRNRKALRDGLVELAARRRRAADRMHVPVWLDVDSIAQEVHGHQSGAEYNGHYHCTCYHPLVAVLGEEGDLVGACLRPGKAHTAEGAADVIVDLVRRLRSRGVLIAGVRMDAGFPSEPLLRALECRGIRYVCRIRSNLALGRLAGDLHLLPRIDPDGVPLERWKELRYRAGSWSRTRRVVCVVVQEEEELFARHFYLLTNQRQEAAPPPRLLACYRQRGTAEGHFGEWMSTVPPSLGSTQRPKSTYRGAAPEERSPSRDAMACNDAALLLSAMAYGLVHVIRMLAQAATERGWGLRPVRERVLKVAARVLLHARRATFVVPAAVAGLWSGVWRALDALGPAEPAPG
jgi:hypothetical protein